MLDSVIAVASLFHSLVVLGAGVTVTGCGGVTSIGSGGKLDEGRGTGATAGRSGIGGAPLGDADMATTGGARSSGGFASGGVDGTGGAGGFTVMGDGGAAPLPDPGTLAQWSCGTFYTCSPTYVDSIRPALVNAPCNADPTRPRSAADCGPDEWFECQAALWMGTRAIVIDCHCTPILDGGCGVCRPFESDQAPAVCSGHTKLCGCAYTGILH